MGAAQEVVHLPLQRPALGALDDGHAVGVHVHADEFGTHGLDRAAVVDGADAHRAPHGRLGVVELAQEVAEARLAGADELDGLEVVGGLDDEPVRRRRVGAHVVPRGANGGGCGGHVVQHATRLNGDMIGTVAVGFRTHQTRLMTRQQQHTKANNKVRGT